MNEIWSQNIWSILLGVVGAILCFGFAISSQSVEEKGSSKPFPYFSGGCMFVVVTIYFIVESIVISNR